MDSKYGFNDIKGRRGYDSTPKGEKAQVGTVKASTRYSTWLKRQPKNFQDEILGKGKGKLFRRGKIKLNQFVDSNFRNLTLGELSILEESSMGINPKKSYGI